MKISDSEIKKVAKLAKLQLSSEEINEFSTQISDIVSYVEKIKELDTEKIQPAEHIADIKNVFREDKSFASLNQEKIKNFAPSFKDGHFVVPKIID